MQTALTNLTTNEPTTSPYPTIVIVEDNAHLRELLSIQMQISQFNPICFEDGSGALEWFKTNTADLVVLDWMLPDMEGIDVCRKLREHYSPRALPILMLSALGKQVDRRVLGLEAGANDFMAKPYEVTELVARIQTQLHMKQESHIAESTLSSYTSRALRRQLETNPERLTRREICDAVILFADLRGFTRLSEQVQPESTMRILDRFFETMMVVVQEHDGCVLDLAGDEMLIIFNFPNTLLDPTDRALKAALAMQRHFGELKSEWIKLGIDIGLGIGIHQGEVALGNLGGPELKRFTVVGTVVNAAHRLVELANDGEIVVSPDVYLKSKSATAGLHASKQNVSLKGICSLRQVYRIDAHRNGKPGLVQRLFKFRQ